ncbi:MAG: nucleoside diphosphate kinase regulator [Sphingopyxis sp.]|uniref:nucleoside diphosphate kinase regulator n=1 Tax=Sphingopyxis sp. TaxID=1908224 RepID=UPI002AB85BC8|nr:nucleoside diphosphate kinase regulator [Sphingopyxis sp.]MDZ3831381.1 nucleoside diphosphate kinase regulator [Sphingopyxis sp.]
MTTQLAARRPRIHMIDTEADALTSLALSKEEQLPQVSELLLGEIERATVHSAAKFPGDIVAMGSTVTFIDEANGAERTVRLVYPGEADIANGRISILTPIGAGLIGLRKGQSIPWPDRDGHKRNLTIVEVEQAARQG